MSRHFVLIHGACHGAWCWYKVSALLKSGGHKVSALDLAASGINTEKLDDVRTFSEYYEPLLEFMANRSAEERVILVGHSMSGFGISSAMEMYPEKISAAVFAAAAMPGPDLSYYCLEFEYMQNFFKHPREDAQVIWGDGPFKLPTAMLLGPKQMADRLYRFSPPEDLELGLSLVRPVPIFSSAEVVYTKERHGSVRRFFVICDEENGEEQRWMVEHNPPVETKVISGSDHMVMFSKPQEFASYLLEIGEKYF